MSANVIRLSRISTVSPTIKKTEKVKMMPNLFQNLLTQYKKKQDELRKKKINFLTKEAYEYFYSLLEFPKLADVDLPEFVYEEQRKKIAHELAAKAMLEVIEQKRINECYKKRVAELKKAQRAANKKHRG